MGAKASKAAGQQLEAAQARFPAEEVSGAVERAGMGETKKSFDTIKSFAWTLGGTGGRWFCGRKGSTFGFDMSTMCIS